MEICAGWLAANTGEIVPFVFELCEKRAANSRPAIPPPPV